jgi:enamine deaminase RidA (YjgF/YER057c/UK114 family)
MTQRVIPASMKAFYDTYHFAPAVIDGDHVRCSGMIGFGADGKVAADPEAQFTQAFANLKDLLTEAGASLADITEMTTFHVGLNQHLSTFTRVKDRFVKDPYPAWTAIGTPELALPGALVEIRVTARLPG